MWKILTNETVIAVLASLWFGLSLLAQLEPLLASGPIDWRLVAINGAHAVFLVFVLVLIWLRKPVVLKAQGLLPRLTALAIIALPICVLAIPKAGSPLRAEIGAGLTLLGMAGAVYCLAYLGRSFSVMPQARALVRSGPYRWCRHPLYLAESVVMAGELLGHQALWAALLFVAVQGVQLRRMVYEERVLRAAFADYDSYAARTARLIPGLY